MNQQQVATFDEKIDYIKVVAERGVTARQESDKANVRASRRQAYRTYEALAAKVPSETGEGHLLYRSAFPDTPRDRKILGSSNDLRASKPWIKHLKKVFVKSFMANEPRPLPPTK